MNLKSLGTRLRNLCERAGWQPLGAVISDVQFKVALSLLKSLRRFSHGPYLYGLVFAETWGKAGAILVWGWPIAAQSNIEMGRYIREDPSRVWSKREDVVYSALVPPGLTNAVENGTGFLTVCHNGSWMS